jgi:hypothetical protein
MVAPTILTSNGVPIPFDDHHFAPLLDSSPWLNRPAELRARLHEDGCLLLRGVIDRAAVVRLRAEYFSCVDPALLAPGTTPAEGIFSGRVPERPPRYGVAGHPAHAFVRSAAFHRFVEDPTLTSLAETLLDGPAVALPRRILRHFHRDSHAASRAHVDADYMHDGSEQQLTMWIPIGDCALDTGGLVYLEGSHRLDPVAYATLRGFTDRPEDRRPISNDLRRTSGRLGGRWLWADYRPGDVAVHLPQIVHASLDTRTDAMRLSADIRFQLVGERVDPRWRKAWSADDGY